MDISLTWTVSAVLIVSTAHVAIALFQGEILKNWELGMGTRLHNNIISTLLIIHSSTQSQLSIFFYFTLLFFQLAEEYGVKFMETSAKTGYNIENVSTRSLEVYIMLKIRESWPLLRKSGTTGLYICIVMVGSVTKRPSKQPLGGGCPLPCKARKLSAQVICKVMILT